MYTLHASSRSSPHPPPASGSFSVVASWGTPGRDIAACSAYLPPPPLTLLVAGMTDHPCCSPGVRPLLSLPQLRNALPFWPKVILSHLSCVMWAMAWRLHHLRAFRLHVVAELHSLHSQASHSVVSLKLKCMFCSCHELHEILQKDVELASLTELI